MKLPWMNYKKKQETISTQKNGICASKVYIRSISSERNSRQINKINSLGSQIKFINCCVTYQDIKEFAKKNKCGQLAQYEHFHESALNMHLEQLIQDDVVFNNQKDDNITSFSGLRKNSVYDESFEPLIDTAKYIGNQNEQSVHESHANMKIDQLPSDKQANKNQKDDITSNHAEFQTKSVSSQPVPDTDNSLESNILDESYKNFDYKEMNENAQSSFKSAEINENFLPNSHIINIRVPVVLGKYNLECSLEEVITFEEKVRRIKKISNKVVLNNCKFVPTKLSPVLDNGTCNAVEGYLFIEGTIHQNIEYISDVIVKFPMNRKICCTTRKSPFSITVKIQDFLHPPIFGSIAQTTFEFLDQNNSQIPQLDTELFHSIIYYPEQVYCQIISSKIHQWVCLTDTANSTNKPLNYSVAVPIKYQLNQKIVLEIFIHLLQIQHVQIKSDDKSS